MNASEIPKRTRCTRRVTARVESQENQAPDVFESKNITETDMLYSNTVARHWNSHSTSKGNVKCSNSSTEEHLDSDRERTPLKECDKQIIAENLISASDSTSRRSQRISLRNPSSSSKPSVSSYEDCSSAAVMLNVKDPTPPSTPDYQILNAKPKTAKLKRSVESAIKRLQRMQDIVDISSDQSFNEEVGSDGDCIEVLEPQFASEQCQVSSKEKITVKIRSLKHGILKYDIQATSHFSEMMKYLSDIEQVKLSNISLYLSDRKLKEYETPLYVGLGVADIIECYVRSSSTVENAHKTENSIVNENSIQLTVQFGAKSKITMTIGKNEPMGKLMTEFCSSQGLTLADVIFMCDGEIIDVYSTPNSLDLEDGFCIDASIYTQLD